MIGIGLEIKFPHTEIKWCEISSTTKRIEW